MPDSLAKVPTVWPKPVWALPDAVYPQKHVAKVTLPGDRHAGDVRSLALGSDGLLYVASVRGVFTVRQRFVADKPQRELMPEWAPPARVDRIDLNDAALRDVKEVRADAQGRIWVAALNGVALCSGNSVHVVIEDTVPARLGAVMSTLPVGDALWVAMSHGGVGWLPGAAAADPQALPSLGDLVMLDEADLPGFAWRLDPGPDGTVWVCGSEGVARFTAGGECIARGLEAFQVRRAWTNSHATYFATHAGVAILGPGESPAFLNEPPVPVEDVHDLLVASGGSLWGATSHGVWRQHPGGHTSYYAGQRWLPHDWARALVETADGTVWVGTANGLAHLADLPTTLEEKAARFEARIRARHWRLKGYVTTSRLNVPGDLSSNEPRPSDNDGLWTALYLAAHAYRYAATGSQDALQQAKAAYAAIEWLEEVTTIPGFPTKAVLPPGDPETQESRMPWYPSADDQWAWKGDCSSDEIAGHFYGYSIYYDLVADAADQARVRALVERIMDHILTQGLYMVGMDGKPTRWCVWAPEKLNEDRMWWGDRGLNSLEILSHLRTVHHITGNPRYLAEYHRLIHEHGYAENVRRQKVDIPSHVNHSDDELAFVSYYPLLKYEDDPSLRAIYLDSLEHAWQIERPERNPWWNLIYGVLTGEACELEAAVRTLREIPLDLITWDVQNSHRRDVQTDRLADRFGRLQSTTVLPYDELPAHKWNFNPYQLDGGNGGRSEEDGTHLILPYWMARYYGFLKAPSQTA